MLTHIHPSRHPFTCRTRPIFNGTVRPGPESGAVQGPPGAQSSFARTRCYLVRRGVSHPVRGHYPSFIAHTNSCVRPNPSHWFRLALVHWVFAGCRQSLLQDGPSRRYLCASFPRCLDPYRGGVPDASTHYFSGTIGLPPVSIGSATRNDPLSDFRVGSIFAAAVIPSCSGLEVCLPPRSLLPPCSSTRQLWRLRPSRTQVVTFLCIGYASPPNG